MPMAPDDMRARWDGPNDKKALAHLEEGGYVLDDQYWWSHPDPDWEPSDEDWDAMNFMILEWDYGGYADQEETE